MNWPTPVLRRKTEPGPRLVPAVVTAPLVSLSPSAVQLRLVDGTVVEIPDIQAVSPEWVAAVVSQVARAAR